MLHCKKHKLNLKYFKFSRILKSKRKFIIGNFIFDRSHHKLESDPKISLSSKNSVDNVYFKVFSKISVLKKVKNIVEKYIKNLYPFIVLRNYDSNFKS